MKQHNRSNKEGVCIIKLSEHGNITGVNDFALQTSFKAVQRSFVLRNNNFNLGFIKWVLGFLLCVFINFQQMASSPRCSYLLYLEPQVTLMGITMNTQKKMGE